MGFLRHVLGALGSAVLIVNSGLGQENVLPQPNNVLPLPKDIELAQLSPQPGKAAPPAGNPNQLPVPIPLQATPPNPPPIPETPQAKSPPPLPLREPGERFKKMLEEENFPEDAFGDGHWCWTGWRYGPRVAPKWEYPGLGGGPQVIYPWGSPGYTGRNGEKSLDRWCRLWGPPVPVYSPIPEISDSKKVIYHGRNISSPGWIYGWVGPFPASPRYKHYDVSAWAQPGVDLSTGGQKARSELQKPPAGNQFSQSSTALQLAVKVPDAQAEVFVDGVKTMQSGVDRSFTSPELEPGKEYRYEITVRWVVSGVTREQKRTVIGASGEVIPLDFTNPEVVTVGK